MIPPTQDYIYHARCTRAIDGDTVELVIDVGFHLTTTQRVRLVDVNTPEDRAGKAATDYTRARLEGRDVLIRTFKADSFGRYLCRLWVPGPDGVMINFSQELIDLGYGVPFMTGTSGV